MCCECCCGTDRCCLDPIIPVQKSWYALAWRYTLLAIAVVHFIVIIVKMSYLGVTSALTDLVSLTVLIIAILRVDYCLAITFAVLNLFEIFAIGIILGYFLQTNLGQNVPGKNKEDLDDDKSVGNHHNSLMQSHATHKTPVVYWHGLFD